MPGRQITRKIVKNRDPAIIMVNLRILAVFGIYLALGCGFFVTFEDKPCENPPVPPHSPWWSRRPTEPLPCREPWTVIDALYFCIVCMSTVGYGDFSPSTTTSAAFTLVYIFVGVLWVFSEISDACSGVLMACRLKLLHFLDRFDHTPKDVCGRTLGLSGESLDIDGNGVQDFILPPPAHVFWAQELLLPVMLIVGLQLGSASIFTWLQDDLSLKEALYHTLITATTVGFGDVALRSQASRLWACVHILFSVAWLAAIISHMSDLTSMRRTQLQRADLLRRQLDIETITALDRDGQGVDKLEFVVGMLITLGCEVCGQPLKWEDVRPFLAKFNALDVSQSGRIDKHDLEMMVRSSRACKALP